MVGCVLAAVVGEASLIHAYQTDLSSEQDPDSFGNYPTCGPQSLNLQECSIYQLRLQCRISVAAPVQYFIRSDSLTCTASDPRCNTMIRSGSDMNQANDRHANLLTEALNAGLFLSS